MLAGRCLVPCEAPMVMIVISVRQSMVLGVVAMMLLCACTAEPASTVAPSPVGPTPTPNPALSPSPTELPTSAVAASLPPEPTWTRVEDQPAFAGGQMVAVTRGSDQFVAVGRTVRTSGDDVETQGAIWASADGTTWDRLAVPGATGAAVSGVISDEDGYVAWGASGTDLGVAFWVSPDGRAWTRTPGIVSPDPVEVTGVARLGDELVAVGRAEVGSPDGDPIEAFRTWVSADGRAWQPVTPSTPAGWSGGVEGLMGTGDALVGWVGPTSLTSTDARLWAAAPVAGDREWVEEIVATDGTAVAVGSGPVVGEAGAPPPPSAIWTMPPDGAWNPVMLQPEPSVGQLRAAVWYPGGFVALGSADTQTVVWRSADGIAWTEASSVPDTAIDGEMEGCTGGPCPLTTVNDLTGGPAGLVAVGQTDEASGGSHAVVWVAPAGAD